MTLRIAAVIYGVLAAAHMGAGQSNQLVIPRSIAAGEAFDITSHGSGDGTLYIAGPGQVLKQNIQLGHSIHIAAGTLYNVGEYLVAITSSSSSTQSGSISVNAGDDVKNLNFIARPSRVPVAQPNAISGTVFVFDKYHNLISHPSDVTFELSGKSSAVITRSVETEYGAAWTQIDSTTQEGRNSFLAKVDDVTSRRIVEQVPGAPCAIQFNATAKNGRVELRTGPVRDCSGNAIPDGTIVTFTERYDGMKSTADVPLKKGVATVSMPDRPGAIFSAASGVVLGNQLRWNR